MSYSTENFSYSEFIKSDTAVNLEINNDPVLRGDFLAYNNLCNTIDIMQFIRFWVSRPIFVTSGYRCKELNSFIKGSAPASDHIKGLAVDFAVAGSPQLCESVYLLLNQDKDFKKFIRYMYYNKFRNFIHISFFPKILTENDRKIFFDKKGYLVSRGIIRG